MISLNIYLNSKMLSLAIYAGYEGGDIAEKKHNNDCYLYNPHESSKKNILLFIFISHSSFNKLID